MTDSSGTNATGAVAGFDRPLLLTPGQDIGGYLGRLLGKIFLIAVTCTSVLAVFLIFFYIIWMGREFLFTHGLDELVAGWTWDPTADEPPADYGAAKLFLGSLYVTAGAMVIAVPIGILAAVCLSDIMPFKLRQIVKPVIEILAAIPSVAYGFFAILVVAPWLQQHLGIAKGRNALNASVLLGIMALPTIVSIAEDALSSIGRDLREGAYALGSTRAEVILKVVMPAAKSGIIAAVILGVMRAVGETMLVWMAAGMAINTPTPWWDFTQQVRTITASIAQEMGEAPEGSMHRQSLFALGFMLLVITFVLNLVSEYFLTRAKKLRKEKTK